MAADVKVFARTESKATANVTRVTVENPGKSLAFFVHLKVSRDKDGEEILPVIWEDNYFSLLPGEKREISATYAASQLHGAKTVVELGGWKIMPKTVLATR